MSLDLTGASLIHTGTVTEVVPTEQVRKRSSPSKYRGIELSPAFVQDQDRPEHPTTTEGKELHRALETGDVRGLSDLQLRLVEMCRELRAALIPAKAKTFREIRFPIIDEDFGFADEVALLGSHAFLLDWKFGHNKQEDVDVNPAAQAYVLGVLQTWPYVTDVTVYYAYPRLEEVSSGRYTRADIPRIITRLRLLKERHNKATPATCKTHDDTCQYCRFLATCPTAAARYLPVAARYAETHEMSVPLATDFDAIQDQSQWSRLLAAVPVMEAAAESIKRRALEWRDATGIEIDGYSVTETRGNREIIDPLEAWNYAKNLGVDQSEFLSCVKVTCGDYMQVLRSTAGKGKKGLVEQQAEHALLDSGAMILKAPGRYLRRDKSTDAKALPS